MKTALNPEILPSLLARAKALGADAADALLVESASLSIGRRMDRPERLERSESVDLGLRVFVGTRQAIVSSTDLKPATLEAMVERAVAMAKLVPEDPYTGIADPDQLAREIPELDLYDPAEPGTEALIEAARAGEAAALAVAGVTNSDGVSADWSQSRVTLAASNGFHQTYQRSRHSLSVSVIAGTGEKMERDYDYTSAIHRGDLKAAEEIGKSAGERAVRRLNPRKAESAKLPLIFDPRVASGFIGTLAGAISGGAIARRTSFLKDSLGQAIFAPGVSIVDDPFIRRGLRSKPFDGEGIAPLKRAVIEDGVLTTWILDLRSARQLGLASTGHASRGTGGPPSPSATNFYLAPGALTPSALLKETGQGLYITELMGPGVNAVTGDYSRGAAGFWIENGELAYPVSEITVAGNLRDMFRHLTPANDLTFRTGIDSPTVRIEGMTVAGR
jgi:PmbA protein